MAEKVTYVTVCDRCGKDERTPAGARSKKNWPIPAGWVQLHEGTRKMDICPDCVKSFHAWMEQVVMVSEANQDSLTYVTPEDAAELLGITVPDDQPVAVPKI